LILPSFTKKEFYVFFLLGSSYKILWNFPCFNWFCPKKSKNHNYLKSKMKIFVKARIKMLIEDFWPIILNNVRLWKKKFCFCRTFWLNQHTLLCIMMHMDASTTYSDTSFNQQISMWLWLLSKFSNLDGTLILKIIWSKKK